MGLRPCSAYTIAHYMTHKSRAQIRIESSIASTASYRMEQVFCQASLSDPGDEDIGQVRSRPTDWCTSYTWTGGRQPSIIGFF